MTRKEFLIIIPSLAVILWLLVNRAILAPFNIEDDYHYVKIAHPKIEYFGIYENPENYSTFSNFFTRYNIHSGRFRPLSLCTLWAFGKISDGNSSIISALLFIFALAALSCFYFLLRSFHVSRITACVFVLLFLTGKYEQIFYRRTGELFGILFLFAGFILYIYSVRQNLRLFLWLSFLSFVFSALFKESFAALLPSIGVGCAAIYCFEKNTKLTDAFLQLRLFLSALLTVFILLATGSIVALKTISTYTFENPITFSIQHFFSNAYSMCGSLSIWISILLIAGIFLRKKSFNRIHVLIILTGSIWIASQLIVYKESDVSLSRYLLPAFVFPLFVSALCTEKLREIYGKKVFIPLLILLSLSISSGAKNSLINSSYYASRATSYNNMLDYIGKTEIGKKDKIVTVIEQGGLYDFMESTAVFLSERKINPELLFIEIKKNGKIKNYPVRDVINDAIAIRQTKEADSTFILQKLRSDENMRIIMFATPAPFCKLNPEIFSSFSYETIRFPRTYFNASWKDIASGNFTKSDTIVYFLLKK